MKVKIRIDNVRRFTRNGWYYYIYAGGDTLTSNGPYTRPHSAKRGAARWLAKNTEAVVLFWVIGWINNNDEPKQR
jgi:hypothetical protein